MPEDLIFENFIKVQVLLCTPDLNMVLEVNKITHGDGRIRFARNAEVVAEFRDETVYGWRRV